MKERSSHWLKIIFFATIMLLSASTSFMYFVEVFTFGNDALTALITGLVGVVITDGAVFFWLRTYLSASDNNDERAFAAWGAAIGAVGSALASFAYIIGGSAVVEMTAQMQTWTTIAMAVIVIVHFALVTMSQYRSTSAQIDERTASLMAEATEEMLKLTEQEFRANIPYLARQNAERATRNLAARFAMLSEAQPKSAVPIPAQAHSAERDPAILKPRKQSAPSDVWIAPSAAQPALAMTHPVMDNAARQPVSGGGGAGRFQPVQNETGQHNASREWGAEIVGFGVDGDSDGTS